MLRGPGRSSRSAGKNRRGDPSDPFGIGDRGNLGETGIPRQLCRTHLDNVTRDFDAEAVLPALSLTCIAAATPKKDW